MSGNTRIIVVGGGYAGVLAANRLTQRDDVSVTLINSRSTFVQRLRLHQFVTGSDEAVVHYRKVLADPVRLVVDEVTGIDATGRAVTLSDGRAVGYDYLVYAVGSASPEPRVPGAREFAHRMDTLEEAQRLRSALDDVPETAPLTVVGGGPTGVETAAELAEQGRRVTLVCGGELVPYLHRRARRTAAKRLAELGVTVLEGPDKKVAEVSRETVLLTGGETLPSQLTVWTVGFGVPDLAARSGLSTDADGRMLTDETLTSVDDDRIVAAGDAVAPSDTPFRKSAYSAGCLGGHAADTILARIAGKRPEPLNLSFNAMCVSLGGRTGIFQIGNRDDVATGVYIPGRAGSALKRLSYKASIKHLIDEARKPGSHTWPKGEKRRRTLAESRRIEA
ncbi:FAD-dependent oxidoreductase [Glycomyces albus]